MSGFVSLIAWTFLPGWVTGFLHKLYYQITISAGSPKPQPGTPRYAEHYRRIYITVVCLYLLFSIYEADWELQRAGDFYSTLGVLPDATNQELKRRYRILSAAMHPDKAGPGQYDAETYINLQTAHATLTDEAKRFAYDRFGPDMLAWKECLVVRDFVMKGAMNLVGYYGAGAAVLYIFPKLGYFSDGIYWRWMAFLALGVFEVYAITRPDFPSILTHWANPLLVDVVNPLLTNYINPFLNTAWSHPPYLPFQAIAIARKLSITLSIALNQVVPFLTADTRRGQIQIKNKRAGGEDEAVRQSLARLHETMGAIGKEADHMMQMEAAPFTDEVARSQLQSKMKRWLVDNTVRSDPMTKDAINRTIMRKRQDAPAGAQGNGARARGGKATGSDP